ncbi:MAG: DUF120 domain-containing protein [Acidobacteria bacterium]|nr:DUF120 domain-containing protein [Acidobacteriota bacterium]
MTRFSGHVVTGRGEAAGFTRLDWVREQVVDHLGIDPFPGTLNLEAEPADLDTWRAVRTSQGIPINPPTADFCAGRCYAVRLNDRVPAGVVVPELPAYPPSQIEIVAAVALRGLLGLRDGDRVTLGTCDRLPVRALIFDVDGTLVESLTAYRVVAERAAAPYGLTISDAIVREALNTTRPFWDLLLPPDLADRASVMETLRREAGRLWPEVLREHGGRGADVGRPAGAGREARNRHRIAARLARGAAAGKRDRVVRRGHHRRGCAAPEA